MAFKLSNKSLAKLEGVDPDLVKVTKLAITHSTIDFAVIEGLRTVERQRELVAKGASQTMQSNHLTGQAVDLAAYIGDKMGRADKRYPQLGWYHAGCDGCLHQTTEGSW